MKMTKNAPVSKVSLKLMKIQKSLFLLVFGILLAWVSTGSPVLSPTNSDTGTGEMSRLDASSLSRTDISPTVGEKDEDEEDEEEE